MHWLEACRSHYLTHSASESHDDAERTSVHALHALDAATGKARSPSVERFVGATTNVYKTEERQPSMSAVRRRQDVYPFLHMSKTGLLESSYKAAEPDDLSKQNDFLNLSCATLRLNCADC